ncbi:hypothetical protein BMETH_1443_0 [methanotrophic bacterial endosymbiont of Bathymodiolus sp.]|nr:hypothetical protein BMETH_1443_0 [methanotrophic bacterial endosymbiont of Bathymodiolus sp.]
MRCPWILRQKWVAVRLVWIMKDGGGCQQLFRLQSG